MKLLKYLKKIDEEILIIGVGPSGRDLVFLLSDVVKSVTLSKRNWLNDTDEGRETYQNRFPKKLVIKDVVKRFTSKGAEFIDGSQKSFSVIIFATGKLSSKVSKRPICAKGRS